MKRRQNELTQVAANEFKFSLILIVILLHLKLQAVRPDRHYLALGRKHFLSFIWSFSLWDNSTMFLVMFKLRIQSDLVLLPHLWSRANQKIIENAWSQSVQINRLIHYCICIVFWKFLRQCLKLDVFFNLNLRAIYNINANSWDSNTVKSLV